MARSEAPASAKAAGNSYPLRLPPPRQSSTLPPDVERVQRAPRPARDAPLAGRTRSPGGGHGRSRTGLLAEACTDGVRLDELAHEPVEAFLEVAATDRQRLLQAFLGLFPLGAAYAAGGHPGDQLFVPRLADVIRPVPRQAAQVRHRELRGVVIEVQGLAINRIVPVVANDGPRGGPDRRCG